MFFLGRIKRTKKKVVLGRKSWRENLIHKLLQDASDVEELIRMSLNHRTLAIAAAAILVTVTISGSTCNAAKRSKVYVPAKIIKGASITKGRAFYSSRIPEDTLAGIRLGRGARSILAKWGNPTRVTVGSTTSNVDTSNSQPAYTPAAANPYGTITQGLNAIAGMYGGQNMLPGLPGLPGVGTNAQQQTQSQSGGTTQSLTEEEVTWTYDLSNGVTLEFIITDGIITQITAGGVGPWKLSRTRSGLELGDTYKLVLWVSGYPESQKYVGRFLRVSYVNKSRALYTFINKKLVGVTIAMVPSEISLK